MYFGLPTRIEPMRGRTSIGNWSRVSLSIDELSGWDRARRREKSENTYVYSKTVARREAAKIAVATVVSRVFPARVPRAVPRRCSYTGPESRICRNGLRDGVSTSSPLGFSGHVATAVSPPRLPKRAITNEKLLKGEKKQQ